MTCTIHPGNYYRYGGEKCICSARHLFSGNIAYRLCKQDGRNLFYHVAEGGAGVDVTVTGATPWVDKPEPLRFSDLAVGEWFQWADLGPLGAKGCKMSVQRWMRFEQEGATFFVPTLGKNPVKRIDPPVFKEEQS